MADLTWNLALVAAVGGALSLDRRAALQLMVSQPLIAVSILGALMGDVQLGVLLGALLQLLWMSCVLFGANIPRNDTLASVTIGGAVFIFANHVSPADPATWTLGILIGAPVCVLGQWLDIKLDHLNLGLAVQADRAAENGKTQGISVAVFLAILRTFLVNATAAAVTTAAAAFLLVELRGRLGPDPTEALSIIGIYLVPALGLAVSLSMLRQRRALALAAMTFIIVSAIITQGQLV